MTYRKAFALKLLAAVVLGLGVAALWLVLGADMWVVVLAGVGIAAVEQVIISVLDRRTVDGPGSSSPS